ncbi:MAG: UDP-glucose/GDP-mannose dehydrogenase family protein, partial [Actinobacteria bacterium]|nr:UDP-glucose/GDP-mannose dehydrogenase family protein [Actinomycetota bacterium]
CIIGTGYVGLVTGVCLAEIGNNVICVDKIKEKVNILNSGKPTIYEPNLEKFLKDNIKKNRLQFTTDISNAVIKSEVIYICVGTPSLSNGQADLKYVEEAANEIGKYINGGKVIVNKSTVPIGSGDWVSMVVSDSLKGNNSSNEKITFSVVSNPEFLREGSAISDTFFPDRIVIGSSSKKAIDKMIKLYEPIINQTFNWQDSERLIPKNTKIPVVISDLTSAEMIKYAANSFLATKISFVNEIANICEKVGADIVKVSEGMGLDKRISPMFLNAGIGWGGSCFPKDVLALSNIAGEYGLSTQILNAVINVNREQRLKIKQKIQDELKIIKGRTIGVLGISFKPNTDDTREAPSIKIMNDLVNLGARVKAYDPIVNKTPQSLSRKVEICSNAYDVVKDADMFILATEWEDFLKLDYTKVKNMMRSPVIIDGRNYLDKSSLEKQGFKYIGIGR